MIGFTTKKYRIEEGSDIENYVGYYCGTYPDNEMINLLKKLSTKSLVKAYVYVEKKKQYSYYYRNLTYHLFVLLEKRNNMINGTLIFDFEEDLHLELAPNYINL